VTGSARSKGVCKIAVSGSCATIYFALFALILCTLPCRPATGLIIVIPKVCIQLGHPVAWLVQVICYKPEGRRFDSR
jgi:hypothetical protein